MKKWFLMALAACCSMLGSRAQQLVLTDPLLPLFPDSNQLSGYAQTYEAAFPSGTTADVHVVFQLPAGTRYSVEAALGGKTLPLSCWSLLRDVPVEQNTGLDSRTEQFKGLHNPYVIRRAPFRVYDAMAPLTGKDNLTGPQPFTALRLAIPYRLLGKTGEHQVSVRVTTPAGVLSGSFKPSVYAARVPELRESRFFYTNWFSMTEIEKSYQVERWSNAWYNMLDRYAALMAHGRQNAILIPGELIYLNNGRIALDEKRMIRYVRLFQKHGFTYFESPHLMNRGANDDWGDPELKVALTGVRYYTPQGRNQVDTLVRLMSRFIRKYRLNNRWLQHISDEPTMKQAACYKDIAAQIRAIDPSIRIMEATNDRDSLIGGVDVWCPLINDFQENEAFFRQREKNNEQVLVYTCLIPGGPWLNRLMDQERIRQVYFGWGAAHYNTSGFLHWGLNQYHGDPWQQSVIHHPAPGATPNNFLPAGDTHVVFPGQDGPLSSTRFEAHRIGIEDYELLTMLKAVNQERARQLMAQLFRSYTDYEKSLPAYRAVRKALLEAL